MGLYRVGKNLAEIPDWEYDRYRAKKHSVQESAITGSMEKVCVFISHKSCDKEVAEYIAEFIKRYLHHDVYLDKWDYILQQATAFSDDKIMVERIQRGLDVSTHLLCLLSLETVNSWWVPYEIGYADKLGISIATAKLRGRIEIPSYLKINEYINDANEMIKWLETLPRYSVLLESTRISSSSSREPSSYLKKLYTYFD